MITGKLCKKMIHADMPYEIIQKVIHDDKINTKWVEDFTVKLVKLNKAHKKICSYTILDKIKNLIPITLQTKSDPS